jgi:hypothetical protein
MLKNGVLILGLLIFSLGSFAEGADEKVNIRSEQSTVAVNLAKVIFAAIVGVAQVLTYRHLGRIREQMIAAHAA